MAAYEYRVVPAPGKGVKARGLKTPEARFAHALQDLMNTMGAEGWEYQRADTLPSTERAGLTGTTTNWRHVLVFRRALAERAQAADSATEIARGLVLTPPREAANDPVSVHPAGPAPAHDTGAGDTADDPAAARTENLGQTRKNPDSSDV